MANGLDSTTGVNSEDQTAAVVQESTAVRPVARVYKTVEISWVEESHHEVEVRVPLDFDPAECNLEDDLATLDPDGFCWLERRDIVVRDVEEHEARVQYFDPPRFHDSPAPARGGNDAGQAMVIPGAVWSAFLEHGDATGSGAFG